MSGATAIAREPGAAGSFVAFVTDAETRDLVGNVARQQFPDAQTVEGGIAAAIAHIGEKGSPQLLVVDISDSDPPLGKIEALADVCDPSTPVIVIGAINDVALYRSLVSGGVVDYLVKPLSPELFQRAITTALVAPQQHASAAPAKPESEPTRRVLTFVGARGGIGASTLAVTTAWLLAHRQRKRVALVDLDLQFGTAALMLDLEPGHGLREALDNPSRIDGLFIASAMAQESDHLFVLSAEEPIADQIPYDNGGIDLLIEELGRSFDYVVIDIPRSLLSSMRRPLELSSKIVVVGDASLAGMRDTLRLLALVKEFAPTTQSILIANRSGARGAEITEAEFTKGVGRKVDLVLPEDVKSLSLAAQKGKPLPVVAAGKPIVKALEGFAAKLIADAGKPAEKPKDEPFWRKILSK